MSAKEPTVTLPLGLARALAGSAYWPAVQADLFEVLGHDMTADLVERRQLALDQWFVSVAEGLGHTPGADELLQAAQAVWARGSRPGGAR